MTPSVGKIILRRVENFNNVENVKKELGEKRPFVSEQPLQSVNSYFLQSKKRSLMRAVAKFEILYSTIQNVVKKLGQMLPVQDDKSTSVIITRFFSSSCFFSIQ